MINLISPINLLWPSRTFRQAAEAELRQTAISYVTRESWPQVKRAHALLPPANKTHEYGVRLLLEYGRWNLALYRTLLAEPTRWTVESSVILNFLYQKARYAYTNGH